MSEFRTTDLWFALVVAIFLAVTVLSLGPAFAGSLASSDFWVMLAACFGGWWMAGFLRKPLVFLAVGPRLVAWFGVGFTFATILGVAHNKSPDLVMSGGFGVVLAGLALLPKPTESDQDLAE